MGLSPREAEVLQMAASGLNAQAIGDRLMISPSTVRNHFSSLYLKLNCSGPVQLGARSMESCLLEPE